VSSDLTFDHSPLPDADSDRVVELLTGASRGPLDPDVPLAFILIQLAANASSAEALRTALERLLDASPD
jgi:hypothetical protein